MFGWLLVGGWLGIFYCKIETKNWLTCLDQLTDCMAGGSPPCLAGRWLVNWYWQRDWQNVGRMLVGGLLGVFEFKIETKWLTCLDWLHGWRLPPLLSWSVVGWLVLAKRVRMLADCWLVGCLVFLYFKIETKMTELTCLDWLHGWRLPSLLSWSVVS